MELKPVPINPVYSKILFAINSKDNITASDIAKILNKPRPMLRKQLNLLLDGSYIKIKDHPQKIKNIKYFYILYPKIVSDFLDFLFEKSKKFIQASIPERDQMIRDEYIELTGLLEEIGNQKKINHFLDLLIKTNFKNTTKENKLLHKLFMNIFSNVEETDKELTLNDIFNFILTNSKQYLDVLKLYRAKIDNTEFQNIMDLHKIMNIIKQDLTLAFVVGEAYTNLEDVLVTSKK